MGLNSTTTHYEHVTEKTFHTAVEIFTYLNFCTTNFKLVSFYSTLFKTESPKDILSALTNLKDIPRDVSDKIFRRVMENFHLVEYLNIKKVQRGLFQSNSTQEPIAPLGKTLGLNLIFKSRIFFIDFNV